MKIWISVLVIVFLSFSLNGQSCKKKYKDKLESSSKLIDCGGNYTAEKTKDGSFVFKRYYPENKVITHLATYNSKKFEVLDGLYQERWDDGTLIEKGIYADNQKVGKWIENGYESGFYKNGVRSGEWKVYDGDSLVERVRNYENGELHGDQIKFDSLGNIVSKTQFRYGESMETKPDTVKKHKEEMPRFPGCENMGLESEALKECAQRKLLDFIYSNIKYPKRSRRKNIQGEAKVQFVIDKDGSITDIKVLRGVAKDIKEELISLVNSMPKWRPGMHDGEPVGVQFTLPVMFQLQ